MIDGCSEALPILADGARKLRVSLSEDQRNQFVAYCSVLREWSAHTNLTAIRTPDGVMRGLFLDALSLIPAIESDCGTAGSLRVVDIGAGAGLPSLPLKIIFPGWSLALVESVGKKARFLREVAETLSLDAVDVHHGRAEELAREPALRDSFDLALARAVSALPSLLELCGPFVRVGGHIVLPKSGKVEAEVELAREAEHRLGLRLLGVRDVLPALGLGEGRKIVVYQKVRPTPTGYPRRTGLAQSRPIGREGGYQKR